MRDVTLEDQVSVEGGLKGVGGLLSNKDLPGINGVISLFPIAQRSRSKGTGDTDVSEGMKSRVHPFHKN